MYGGGREGVAPQQGDFDLALRNRKDGRCVLLQCTADCNSNACVAKRAKNASLKELHGLRGGPGTRRDLLWPRL